MNLIVNSDCQVEMGDASSSLSFLQARALVVLLCIVPTRPSNAFGAHHVPILASLVWREQELL